MGSSISQGAIQGAQVPLEILADTGLDGVIWPKQAILEDNADFDYIIAGGGTAGCVLARRLAEDKNNTVLVLEAGDDTPIPALIAALFPLLVGSFVDYNYTSTPDDYAAKGQNGVTMLTSGAMLGGSASMNHFIHTRGVPSDFDCWDKICKKKTWNYDSVLPYFKKSETVTDKDIISAYGKFHGTDGPMGISRQPEGKKVADILASFAEVGNPTLLDLNADKFHGYAEPQYMLAKRLRETPSYSYLKPIKDYPNLYISKNTKVIKVIIENNIAVAVQAVYKGKTYTFRARKEIIVSAGVYNSPQLLMLSGIGPKEHLESFKIEVLKDLPVGDNFIDQVAVHITLALEKYLIPVPDIGAIPADPTKIPFPVIVGAVALNKSQSCPEYQTFGLKLAHDTPFLTLACHIVFGLKKEICDKWQKEVISRDSLYTVLTHLQPKSRGTVRLNSTDPFDKPIITTGYYKNYKDLQDMRKFILDFISVTNTKYFKEIGAKVIGLDHPACVGKEKDSPDFWNCYILNHSGSPYHSVGTCPMGKVVDCELRVKGVKKLRVVDASVMPNVPRAAPNAAVVMIAEKAADMIKNADAA